MYYDDEARRFNFFSGLLLGALLGTGLALLTSPQSWRSGSPRRIRNAAASAGRGVRAGAGEAQERARRVADSTVTRIRSAADRVRK